MIIHSVTPTWYLMEQPAAPTMEVAGLDGGYLEGVRQGRDLIISRVISTDPAVYLKPEFAPGSTYTLPQSDNNPSC